VGKPVAAVSENFATEARNNYFSYEAELGSFSSKIARLNTHL